MKRRITIAALALLTGISSALAHDYTAGSLKIEHPWTRATPNGAKVAGGFMKITNIGKEPDRLIGGSAIGSGRLEIHEMAMSDNVMKMRELEKGLEIKPQETIELKPGSYHVMFMGLQQAFTEGGRIKGTLVFEKAGTIEIEYAVQAMGAQSDQSDHQKMKH